MRVHSQLFIILNGAVGLARQGVHIDTLEATVDDDLGGRPFFGEICLLDLDVHHPYTATSRTPSSILTVPCSAAFKREIKGGTQLAMLAP